MVLFWVYIISPGIRFSSIWGCLFICFLSLTEGCSHICALPFFYPLIFQWMFASQWLVKLPWEVSSMLTVFLVLVFNSFNIIYLGIIVIIPYFFCLAFQRPDDLFPKVLISSSILTSSGMGFWFFSFLNILTIFSLKNIKVIRVSMILYHSLILTYVSQMFDIRHFFHLSSKELCNF